MEQEVESLVPLLNSYLYRCRVGEIGENANKQDGNQRMLSISPIKSIKLHVLLHFFFNSKVAGKYIAVCKEYIFLFRLIIYVLYSFTHIFTTIYIGLLFTPTVVLVDKRFTPYLENGNLV